LWRMWIDDPGSKA